VYKCVLILSRQVDEKPRFGDVAVLTRPGTTLAEQCALELFSYFMQEIASRIEKIGSQTETMLHDPGSVQSTATPIHSLTQSHVYA
jgi:hypothetical protein